MYEIFSKGTSIKDEITRAIFPAKEKIELWGSGELKRYEILERPIRNLFENDVEHDRFVQDLIKGLKFHKNIEGGADENSILYGCELEGKTIPPSRYITLKPGLFIHGGKIHQIYPSCYVASRQLEKEAELSTENGLEYINITYENQLFNAYIKVFSKESEIAIIEKTRGVDLIQAIKTALNGVEYSYAHAHEVTPTKINIVSSLEEFQLEPVFKHSSGTEYIKFKNDKIVVESSAGSDFYFGSFTVSTQTQNDAIKWKGIGTSSYRDKSIINSKLADMENLTIKGNVSGSTGTSQDIEKDDLIDYFQMVTTDTVQDIIETKTFTVDQKIDNNISLIFKNDTGNYGWNIKNNSSNVLEIIKGGASPSVLASIDGNGIFKAVKFETNGSYTLNNLNVEKFNGHTIDSNSTPDVADKNSLVFWKSSANSAIKKTTFKDLPVALYDKTTPANSFNGLMASGHIQRIEALENATGIGGGGSVTNLIGTINSEVPDGPGGNVTLYSTHIYLDNTEAEKISERLGNNKEALEWLEDDVATQVPDRESYFDADNNVIISVKNNNPVWGKITDSQIDSQISKVKSTGAKSDNVDYYMAFWNNNRTALHHNSDVIYNPSTQTLTATNVTSRSSITLKKDIRDFNESAFDTIDKINVVSFHFIDDESQADKVGFIAEYSPSLVAGKDYNKMDLNNCVGLLIKAVQELKEENKELRDELNYIRYFR